LETDGETEYKKVAGGKIVKVSIPELLNGVEEATTRRVSARDKEKKAKTSHGFLQLFTQRRSLAGSIRNSSHTLATQR
jgi:hypothetical protein